LHVRCESCLCIFVARSSREVDVHLRSKHNSPWRSRNVYGWRFQVPRQPALNRQ